MGAIFCHNVRILTTMITRYLALILASFSALTVSLRAEEMKNVTVAEAAKLVQEKKVTVLDVRTAGEFKDGHIEGAKNIDFTQTESFKAALKELDKTQPYLVHCQAGGRSGKSMKIFKELGFEKILHLEEGFGGWEDAKQPVAK